MKTIRKILCILLAACLACGAFSAAAVNAENYLPPVLADAGTITYGLKVFKVTGDTCTILSSGEKLLPGDVAEVRVQFGTDFYTFALNCLVMYDRTVFAPYADGGAINGVDGKPFLTGTFRTYADDAPVVTFASGSQGTFYDTLAANYGMTGTTNDNRFRDTYFPLYMREGYADGTAAQTSDILPEYANLGYVFASFMAGQDSARAGELMRVPYATYFSFRLIVRDGVDTDGETTPIFIPVRAQRTANTIAQQSNVLCGYTADRSTISGATYVTYGQGVSAAYGEWEGYVGHGAHAWDYGPVTTPATCESAGERTYTCTVCGKQKTEPVDRLGHIWLVSARQDATCSAAGYIVYRCARDASHTYTETLEALPHTWSDTATVTRQPTCSVPGERTYTCTVCGALSAEEIPTIEHTWDDGEVILEPGCGSSGVRQYTCTVCGKTRSELIPGTAHQWGEPVVTREATCIVKGERVYTCTVCGEERTEKIPMTDHTWDDGVVTKQPTCTAYGEKLYTCLICGATDTESLPAAHTWDEGVVLTEPTCRAAGSWLYTCLVCGETKTEAIPKTAHTWGEWVVVRPATTETRGLKQRTCTVCGAKASVLYFSPEDQPQGLLSVTGEPARPGGTVQVVVSLQNNPGLAALRLHVAYDPDVLTLVDAADAGLLGTDTFQAGQDLTANPYTVFWMDALAPQDYTQNGDLLLLTFRVASDAPAGETTVAVSFDQDSTVNTNLEPVALTSGSGTVGVVRRVAGDVNGDGRLDLKDVTLLRRYLAGGWTVTVDTDAADVNGSGTVTLVDVMLIVRFLAGGWNVTLQ